nr:toll-like receptor 12 [Misgurnus anguillicaudatus]
MGVYGSNGLSLFWVWRFALCLSTCNVVFALINKKCFTIEEHLLRDMPKTAHCHGYSGKGFYADCNITDLRKDLSEVTPQVRSLCISGDIKSIPANAFANFPSLEVLEINGYNLMSIESGAFSGLTNLKYLWMLFTDGEECSSVAMDSLVFAGLANLEELTLIGVKLANVSSSLFDPLTKINKLKLSRICEQDLAVVFCYLPVGMSHLKDLEVTDSFISTITDNGCPDGSRTWPSNVLAGIQNLDLTGNPIKVIQAHSLLAFQNLSSLMMEFRGEWLGKIWESGIGQVGDLCLRGHVIYKYSTNVSELCHLISRLSPHSLSLSYIKIDRWTAEDLKDCGTKLRELDFENSEVIEMDFGFWKEKPEIQTLMMADMKLKEAPFCDAANGTLWSLKTLDLSRNFMTDVKGDQFACMPLLEKLVLNNNAIKTLMPHAFRGFQHLKILDLGTNKISQLSLKDFRYLKSLEILLINDNLLENIEDGTFRYQQELRELEFGKLEYVYTLHLDKIFTQFPPKMQRLSIDTHYGTTFYEDLYATPPEGMFDLELIGGRVAFSSCNSSIYRAVRELKVTSSHFICKSDFMIPYFPNLESFEMIEVSESAFMTYGPINLLHRLKRLKLFNLNFTNHTDVGTVFQNLRQLQILVLVNCRLSFLTKSMFKDLISLQLLFLHSDSPLVLVDGLFDVLPALSVFVLDKVNFQCDCENGWILDWADSTKKVQVIYAQKQECTWHYQKRNFLATMEKLCQTDTQFVCYVATAATISLMMFLAVGYHFARWPTVILYFRLRGFVEKRFGRQWQRRRRRLEQMDGDLEEVKYDAFVSYCSRDEAWVQEEMVPRLEEQGHLRLRLCLHNRDFEVGKGIVDNIAESIYSSQCTVCLISRCYLRSDWCGLEMRLATHRQLEGQNYRLILVFLEHISPFELSAFHRLARLVRSHTYLDWPEDEADRVNFWDRLRRNIAEEDMNAS